MKVEIQKSRTFSAYIASDIIFNEKAIYHFTKRLFDIIASLIAIIIILQFFNSLKGDISIVGPRPERIKFHNQFCEEINNWDRRLLVKGGITGLAQVNGGYDLSPAEKLVYDLEYIKNRSVRLDIMILWKTVLVVFNHKGAR